MLAVRVGEPVGPGGAPHGAGGVAWSVQVPRRVEAGVELRGARRRSGGRQAAGVASRAFPVFWRLLVLPAIKRDRWRGSTSVPLQ
jgi:hypothetical protein